MVAYVEQAVMFIYPLFSKVPIALIVDECSDAWLNAFALGLRGGRLGVRKVLIYSEVVEFVC